MHEDALDDSVLLSDLRHLNKSCVRISAILLDYRLHPVALVVDVLLVIILVPELDLCASYGYVDDSDPYVFRKYFDHLAAKEVYRAHVVALTADRRYGCIPLAHLSVKFRHVDCRHKAESRIIESHVLLCRSCAGLHVRLAYAQIDVEVRIRLLCK